MINIHLSAHKQRGIITLAIAMVVLMTLSIVSLFTASAVISEQRISNNSYNGEQAFSSAQAGLNYGINYLESNRDTIVDGQVITGTLPSGASYSVAFNFVGSKDLVKIVSTGTNADNTTSRKVAQLAKYSGGSSSIPNIPLQARSRVTMKGNARIYNLFGGETIHTGDYCIYLSGNARTYLSSGISSDAGYIGPDITYNMADLRNMSDADLQNSNIGDTVNNLMTTADITYSSSGNTNYSSQLGGLQNKTVAITQSGGYVKINGNTTVGASGNPVTLLVNGKVKINGNTLFFGNVYATGQVFINGNAKIYGMVLTLGELKFNGNGEIHGAAVTGYKYNASGNSKLYYTPGNLGGVSTGSGKYGKVFGSWQDMGQ